MFGDILRKLKAIFSQDVKKLEEIEDSELALCKALLGSVKLEQKLSAISYVQEMLGKIRIDSSREYVYITDKSIYEWALSSGFITDALYECNHTEVIKRGMELLVNFCKTSLASIDIFNIVWHKMDIVEDKALRLMMEHCLDQMIRACKTEDSEKVVRLFY